MPNQAILKRYIWELPVRMSHWVNVLSIVILAITGYFIGNPASFGSSASDYTMGWIRFVHFVAAYAFTVSVVSRLIWSLIGNKYAGWREFFPFLTADGRKNMVQMLRYYMFIDRKIPETVGHNSVATTAYFVLFLFYILMILTGFALYAEHAPNGMMHSVLAPMYSLFSNQGMRLAHHLSMWMILGFVINHIYSVILMDIKGGDGEIQSMFTGHKISVKE